MPWIIASDHCKQINAKANLASIQGKKRQNKNDNNNLMHVYANGKLLGGINTVDINVTIE